MSRRLFGTDGVRGVAGSELSAELALALGRAVCERSPVDRPRMLIVRDTRESGPMLEAALAAGAASSGADVVLGGVLPTPAAPLLIARDGYDLAAVVSASHNPYADNGIKFFGPDGFKLTDEAEHEIEALLAAPDREPGTRIGRIERVHTLTARYLEALADRFGGLSLEGTSVVLDCANGATYEAAPAIFRRLGARVTVLAEQPDGRNINAGCGSTHLGALSEAVPGGGHDLGFAFDGDGDRVLAVDRNGVVVDGDELIALAALSLERQGRLAGGGVAVTVMSNYGFHRGMREAGIDVAVTAVGDRYVLEELRARGWTLGGEQSGHIIDMGFVPTGDGIASALLTLEALGGGDLAERSAMDKLPQKLVNVRVEDRQAVMTDEYIITAIDRAQVALSGRGRVLVRPSGTEQLVRVMVEAPSESEADGVCQRLVAAVSERHG